MMRDFGPMYKAERAARLGKKLEPGDSSKTLPRITLLRLGKMEKFGMR